MKVSKSSQTDRTGIYAVADKFTKAGYIFREQSICDYGIDAQIELVEEENVTGNLIALQIKSGTSWFNEQDDIGFVYRGDRAHLNYWLEHSLPVLLVLHNPENQQTYWQAITISNVSLTGKAWKISVPIYQKINPGMDVDLKRLVKKLPIYNASTIGNISDSSHGLAKRYSARIILNREHTQAEIIELIKITTIEIKNCGYYRNDLIRLHWMDKPADVVWLFIYPTTEDEKNNNFLCRTEWFSRELSEDVLPMSNNGEEITDELKIDWNNEYLAYSRFNSQHTISKEKFLSTITKIVNSITPFILETNKILANYDTEFVSYEILESHCISVYKEISVLYDSANELGLSPYECKDISEKFQTILCYAHNIYLFYSGFGKNKDFPEDQKIFNIRSQIGYYLETLPDFEFELKKVN